MARLREVPNTDVRISSRLGCPRWLTPRSSTITSLASSRRGRRAARSGAGPCPSEDALEHAVEVVGDDGREADDSSSAISSFGSRTSTPARVSMLLAERGQAALCFAVRRAGGTARRPCRGVAPPARPKGVGTRATGSPRPTGWRTPTVPPVRGDASQGVLVGQLGGVVTPSTNAAGGGRDRPRDPRATVVLPAPLGPMRATASASRTAKRHPEERLELTVPGVHVLQLEHRRLRRRRFAHAPSCPR